MSTPTNTTTKPAPMSQSEFDEFCARWAAASPEVRSALAKHLAALEAPAAASGAGTQLPPLPAPDEVGRGFTADDMHDYARAALAAAPAAAPDLGDELHGRIMNLPVRDAALPATINERLAYKRGHRDARHAAAELVGEAQAAPQAPAAAQAQQWIPVSERLPEDRADCIFYSPDLRNPTRMLLGIFIDGCWMSCGYEMVNVTHWMPKPDVPGAAGATGGAQPQTHHAFCTYPNCADGSGQCAGACKHAGATGEQP